MWLKKKERECEWTKHEHGYMKWNMVGNKIFVKNYEWMNENEKIRRSRRDI